jgi:hypothetical protein
MSGAADSGAAGISAAGMSPTSARMAVFDRAVGRINDANASTDDRDNSIDANENRNV